MPAIQRAAGRGGKRDENETNRELKKSSNTHKNNSHSIQNKWSTYINILEQHTSTRSCSLTHMPKASHGALRKSNNALERTNRRTHTKNATVNEHKVQQQKKEITMTHLMKADFQFYLFYIYSIRSFALFSSPPCSNMARSTLAHPVDGLFLVVCVFINYLAVEKVVLHEHMAGKTTHIDSKLGLNSMR